MLSELFESKIERLPFSGCWIWLGTITTDGYGVIDVNGKQNRAHRLVYECLRGPILKPQLDHLCRVRCCVNPEHLEPVTNKVNVLRGQSFSALNAKKTHCPHGHPYSESNTYIQNHGRRRCARCHAIKENRRQKARRAERRNNEREI